VHPLLVTHVLQHSVLSIPAADRAGHPRLLPLTLVLALVAFEFGLRLLLELRIVAIAVDHR
jgi:hypothetical protein